VRLDSGNGEFEATQHEGLRVIVSNATQTSCTLPSLPALTLLDSKDRRLAIPATKPNPAPPSASIVVAPGASVSSVVRWVDGNVFTNGVCQNVATFALKVGMKMFIIPFKTTICGPSSGSTIDEAAFIKG